MGFWTNLEIQDGGPIWATFGNHDVILASCEVITHNADLKRNNFRRTIHITVAFTFSKLGRGPSEPPSSPPPARSRKSKKRPVWIGLN